MSETEKSTIIKLDEHQFQHLSIILNNVSLELKGLGSKVERLENAVTKIEGELKLIRLKKIK
jgi:hypothetical protein